MIEGNNTACAYDMSALDGAMMQGQAPSLVDLATALYAMGEYEPSEDDILRITGTRSLLDTVKPLWPLDWIFQQQVKQVSVAPATANGG